MHNQSEIRKDLFELCAEEYDKHANDYQRLKKQVGEQTTDGFLIFHDKLTWDMIAEQARISETNIREWNNAGDSVGPKQGVFVYVEKPP